MGGPAYHVSLLSGSLMRPRFETLLVTGSVGPGEVSMADVADAYGANRHLIDAFGPELRPIADARALRKLIAVCRWYRPDIVHTHTAKAGVLGRTAALAIRPRPVIVHTYHGHVLEGYFGRLRSEAYCRVERTLARFSDRLVGVSQATVDDLVRLRIAPRAKFTAIPLGLDLQPLVELSAQSKSPIRRAAGAGADEVLLVYMGRVVAIKRIELLVRAVAQARADGAPVRLVVVGDGPCRQKAEQTARELGIATHVAFVGYRRDVAEVVAGADVGVLASDNEGTPVSLIEMAAGGRPLISTDVGGVREVVVPEAGILVPKGDAMALAAGITRLAADADVRREMGQAARDHVRERFSASRLVRDVSALYDDLLSTRP